MLPDAAQRAAPRRCRERAILRAIRVDDILRAHASYYYVRAMMREQALMQRASAVLRDDIIRARCFRFNAREAPPRRADADICRCAIP